jgi:hypothetical protein
MGNKDKDKTKEVKVTEMDTDAEGTFIHGIRVSGKGIRIRGATIHLKAVPARYGYGIDYIIGFELPNKKQVLCDSSQHTQMFSDVCDGIWTAVMGTKPKTYWDKVTTIIEGMPLRLSEFYEEMDETIPPDKSPDPLKIMTQPEMEEKPKEEEKKRDADGRFLQPISDSSGRFVEPKDKSEMDSQPVSAKTTAIVPKADTGISEMMGYA